MATVKCAENARHNTRRYDPAVVYAVAGLLLALASPTLSCPTGCTSDEPVTAGQIVIGVSIALGHTRLGDCVGFDEDHNDAISVDELIAAVDAVRVGCVPATATLTLTATVTPTATQLPSPTATSPPINVTFTDVTQVAGLDYLQFQVPDRPPVGNAPYFTGGAAAGDYDHDGWVDLYVTRLDAPGILFHNKGDGTFEDRTAGSGLEMLSTYSNGAAWADIDNDGDLDLYVTTLGDTRYYLFINDGTGHFTEEARQRSAAIEGPDIHQGFSPAFGDFDRDGYLDLVVGEWRFASENPTGATSNARLLHNRGAAAPGFFEDVTLQAGVAMDNVPPLEPRAIGVFPFTPRFADLDDDGWPDLVVTADFGTSRLFWNNHDGTFADGTVAAGVGTDENGMGSAIGDYDGDGRLDWFVTSIFDPNKYCSGPEYSCFWGNTGNRLYHNEGHRTFTDATDTAGVRDGYWGWGTAFLDYDNDGDLDLVMTNGVRWAFIPQNASIFYVVARWFDDPMRLWRNDGGLMTEVSAAAGITSVDPGKALLTFDYNNDGNLDVFVVNNSGHPVLYRNNGGGNSWLRVKAIGRDSNRDGIGARVVVTPTLGGASQLREIDAGSQFLAQSEFTAHFGLGPGSTPVAEVRVEWPATGRSHRFENVPRNTTLVVTEPPAAE